MQNLLNFFINFFKRNLYLKLSIIGIIVIVLSVYLFSLTFPKKEKQTSGQQSQVTFDLRLTPSIKVICNVSIEQPKCYEGDFATPTFKWEYCDSNFAKNQKIFRVQVDDQAYESGVFHSPEIDSGEVESTDTKYSVSSAGLEFNSTYYWGVTAEDVYGAKEGWWGWGDKNFKTAPSCKETK